MSGDFAHALIDAARSTDATSSAFVQGVRRGACDRQAIRKYATGLYARAAAFPSTLTAMLAICDDDRMRRFLDQNLREEAGGAGTIAHPILASRFARAAGATDDDLSAARVEPSRWFRAALASRNLPAAAAFASVGIESNVPRTFHALIDALERFYGFSRIDLEYLTEHLGADERHGQEAAEVIAELAVTPAMRKRALEGARRGATSWWMFHRLLT